MIPISELLLPRVTHSSTSASRVHRLAAIRIRAGSVQLDGAILANGGNGGGLAGGGSGGAIWLAAKTLSRSGAVQSAGGAGDAAQGGGGDGGCIAIYYENGSAFAFSNVVASGGSGLSFGLNGTVVSLQTNVNLPARLHSSLFITTIQKPATLASPLGLEGQTGTVKWVLEYVGPPNVHFSAETLSDLVH